MNLNKYTRIKNNFQNFSKKKQSNLFIFSDKSK
jgi:hypothetical protein